LDFHDSNKIFLSFKHVAVERTSGDLFLSWDAIDALKEWSEAHQAIPLEDDDTSSNVSFRGVNVLQTSDAKLWKSKHNSTSTYNTADAIFHFDWTYSTPFLGKMYGLAGSSGWTKLEASGMPMHLLTDQSVPILYFDEVILYEDDLHDNGEVQMSVKLRVMPTCAYILSKLFVRVDNVLLRLRESRLLVDFESEKLYRDVTWRECQWEELEKQMLPTSVRAWTPDNKELPAFMQLLNKIPLTELPEDIFPHAEMSLEGK
jgi:type 2A phosphatase activator TIP41